MPDGTGIGNGRFRVMRVTCAFSIGSLPKDEQSGLIERLQELGPELPKEAKTTLSAFTAYRHLKKWSTKPEADILPDPFHHAERTGDVGGENRQVSVTALLEYVLPNQEHYVASLKDMP